MSTRIYPVPVKRPSGITNWGQWPDDVEAIIWRWNHGKRLSFSWPRSRAFKCVDCEEFCHQLNAANFDGDLLCDDCLIERARNLEEQG